jgi:nucleoside 2-deoxyribosyltransferase
MKKTIYLSGTINPLAVRTYTWREDAERVLQPHFNVLSPLRGKHDTLNDSTCVLTAGMCSSVFSARALVARDRADVTAADIILVNFDSYGTARMPVGTLFEVAWAGWLHKPVLAFYEGDVGVPEEHPFISVHVTEWFGSLDTVLEHTVRFWA